MREIATKKKPVFVQANSNSGQGHVLHYITSFCVVFRLSTLYFWLAGKTETKQVVNRMSKWVEGGGSWKGHESGQAVFIFLAASPLVLALRARISRLRRSCARLNKTAMLRRLRFVKLSHTELKTKAGVGKVKHELFHLVVQVNQGKTLPLTFLTGIHSKNDDGTTVWHPRAFLAQCRRELWLKVVVAQCTLVKCNALW